MDGIWNHMGRARLAEPWRSPLLGNAGPSGDEGKRGRNDDASVDGLESCRAAV
jgi:hypothetical protein